MAQDFKVEQFNLSQVEITDSYYKNAFGKELSYLKSLNPDKLLSGFYETKGLSPKAEKYDGWENAEIRGHTMGHFLTAAAQACCCEEDKELSGTLSYIIDELKKCQLENGYLSAFEEALFDNVENKLPAWVPWYTMHKIISGLIQVFYYTNNDTALQVVKRLGDWVYYRTNRWTDEIQRRVLAIEYGGMNDCMYDLYKITNDLHHLEAAHKFDELSLFESVADGKDILNGLHANTTIPKFLGALNRYLVLGEGESFYLKAAVSFWNMVTDHHSYITGGNSEWEHFGEPDVLDARRTNCTCETCNSYNMLRLSKLLFMVTFEKKYADFYDSTMINSILSSQNPETGMTTYFQPMATGYFKVYSTPYDKFWCCTGTGMENFTKLNEGIYFYKNSNIFVNRFVSSILTSDIMKVKLIQESKIPEEPTVTFTVLTELPSVSLNLNFCSPNWASSPISASINGEPSGVEPDDGYLSVQREWKNGDTIRLFVPMAVSASILPDNPNTAAFQYGPVVLSAALGTHDMQVSSTGVMVTIPTKNFPVQDLIVVSHGEVRDWIENISANLIKTDNKMEFMLHNTQQDGELVFSPHYKRYKERYGIYWNIVKPNSPEFKHYLLKTANEEGIFKLTVDSIPIGNDQHEFEHEIKGERTQAGIYDGKRYRCTEKDGWFSYQVKVDPTKANILYVQYHGKFARCAVCIYADTELLAKEYIKPIEPFDIYSRIYPIPESLTCGKSTITIRFEPSGENGIGGVFEIIRILRDFN